MIREGSLRYPLGRYRPKQADPGCWVYFLRGGKLAARARADDFVNSPTDELDTYTGEDYRAATWDVVCSEMIVLPCQNRIPMKGFQSFRYVTEEEQADFERAFER